MSSTAHPETDRRAIRGQATRQKIVDAAREVLIAHGHAGASTRAVAEAAGVHLSQVHYHFGGRHGLLLEVLAQENEALLERQRALYAAPGPLSEKWRIACDFLDKDLGSGYVRVLWELWAAGLTDPELAAGWSEAMRGWRDLLESVFAAWADELQIDLPLPPRALATLVGNLFEGIEIELLAGVEAPHGEVLEAIGALIEGAEAHKGYDALARGWASK
jgi:AcrR family transcriptional regulator